MSNDETHYIPALTARNGRQQLAACNIWVRADQHADEPTCATCQAYVLDDSRELSAEDVFGAIESSQNVKPSFAANSDAHYNRYGERRR